MSKLISTTVLAVALTTWILWPQDAEPPTTTTNANSTSPTTAVAANLADNAQAAPRELLPLDAQPIAKQESRLEVAVVVEQTREPVRGAGIEIAPLNGTDMALGTRLRVSDAAGRCEFADIAPGRYRLHCDLGEPRETVVELAAGATTRHTFEVLGGHTIRGAVVDVAGTPVAGATVWQFGSNPLRGHTRTWPVAKTDGQGAFVLEDLDGNANIRLRATHADHAASPRVQATLAERSTEVRLQLGAQPTSLTITVNDGQTPIGDALVGLAYDGESKLFERTDEQGRCTFGSLHEGSVTASVRATGRATAARRITLEPGGERQLTFALLPAAAMHGIVRSSEGVPLAGIRVNCTVLDSIVQAITGDDGRYAMDTLTAGPHKVVAFGDQHHAGCAIDVELQPGEHVQRDFALAELPCLRGRVVDESGHPVQDMRVLVFRQDQGRHTMHTFVDERGRWDTSGMRATAVDTDGTFILPVMPGVDYLLDLSQEGQWLSIAGERFGAFRAPQDDILLTVHAEDLATAYVHGRARTHDGRPVAGAQIQIADGEHLGTVGKNTPGSPWTADDVAFSIGPLPARAYHVLLRPREPDLPQFRTAELTLSVGQSLDLGDVALPQPGVLEIEVDAAPGVTPTDIVVQLDAALATDTSPQQFARCDENGRTRLGVIPGSYRLTLHGRAVRNVVERIEVKAGETTRREYFIPFAIDVFVDFAPPPGIATGKATVRGPDGVIAFEAEIDTAEPFGSRWQPALLPGPNVADFVAADGRRFRASFLVAEQDIAPGKPPATLTLHWLPID